MPKERLLDSSLSFVNIVGAISEGCQGEERQEAGARRGVPPT